MSDLPPETTDTPVLPKPEPAQSAAASPRAERADFARPRSLMTRQREQLSAGNLRRAAPDSANLARRRTLLRRAKWALPAAAILLLGSIIAWPEVEHLLSANKTVLRELANIRIESGNLVGATYRGVDEQQRPFMITADSAHQINDNRMDLTNPVADILPQSGGWMLARSAKGVYMQHAHLLDLTGNVTLYRSDGLMMHTPMVDIDVRRGIAASDAWVHIEGPFGQLDAQGFLLSQHDGIAQFRGPGRLILNDDRHSTPDQSKKAS